MQPATMSLAGARAVWRARQLLDGTQGQSLVEVVTRLGGLPCPSSASPVLALFARGVLERREPLDRALFRDGTLALVPGPRGLRWVAAVADAPALRAFAVAEHAAREARLAAACGLSSRDLIDTRDALRNALATPRTVGELREVLPSDAQRSLGDSGRRAGCATLASLVLRGMWSVGEVTREPARARLDDDTWRYRLDPMARSVPPASDAVNALASRFFAAHGPVSLRTFSLAFGLAPSRAATALKALQLRTVHVEGLPGDLLVRADDPGPEAVEGPSVDLLPVRDPLVDARPALEGICDPAWVRTVSTRDATAPLVLVDGAVAGTWHWDPVAKHVRLDALSAWTPAQREAVELRAEALGRFIAAQLEDPALHVVKTARTASRASAALEL